MFVFVFLSGTLVGSVGRPHPAVRPGAAGRPGASGCSPGTRRCSCPSTSAGATLVLILPPIAAVLEPIGRLLRGVDLSYGLYLYAWPVQQLVAMYALADTPRRSSCCRRSVTCGAGRRQLVPRRAPVHATVAATMSEPADEPTVPALRYDQRPDDDTPVHTADLPDTPTRDRNIVASRLDRGAGRAARRSATTCPAGPRPTYKRRIGTWLLWRAGPASGGDARYWAADRTDLARQMTFRLYPRQHRRRHRPQRRRATNASAPGKKTCWVARYRERSAVPASDRCSPTTWCRESLPVAHETASVRADGRPLPAVREQLRRIPSWRNARRWSAVRADRGHRRGRRCAGHRGPWCLRSC